MSKTITLCANCLVTFIQSGFSAESSDDAKVELKRACENCGRKGDKFTLARYAVQAKKRSAPALDRRSPASTSTEGDPNSGESI